MQHVVRVDMQAPRAVARKRQRRARRLDLEQPFLLRAEARGGCGRGQADEEGERDKAVRDHVRSSVDAMPGTIATTAVLRAERTLTRRGDFAAPRVPVP